MANNPALQNAAVAGITGGAQERWLTQLAASDYDTFRIKVLLIAVQIDSLIDPIDDGPSVADTQLMEAICAGVFANRFPNAEIDFIQISSSIVALWTSIRDGLISGADINVDGTNFNILSDDFQSGPTIVNPGTANIGGLGETGWLGVFVSLTAGTAWGPPSALPSGARGVSSLGGLAAAADISAICRGNSPTSPVCHVRDIKRIDYYTVGIDNQGVLNKFAYLGLNNNWTTLSGLMGVQSNTPATENWILRRSGIADLDTGVPLQRDPAGSPPFFIRFQQRQDGTTGLGSGRWDLYIADATNPDISTPVVENFDGGAVGGNPAATTNYGMQVQYFSNPIFINIDKIEFESFPLTLQQQLTL